MSISGNAGFENKAESEQEKGENSIWPLHQSNIEDLSCARNWRTWKEQTSQRMKNDGPGHTRGYFRTTAA